MLVKLIQIHVRGYKAPAIYTNDIEATKQRPDLLINRFPEKWAYVIKPA